MQTNGAMCIYRKESTQSTQTAKMYSLNIFDCPHYLH